MYFLGEKYKFFAQKNFIIWCQSQGRLCVKFSFRFLSLFPDLTAWWNIFSKNKREHFLYNYLRVLFCSLFGSQLFLKTKNNIGLSRLTSLQFILWYVAGFYKPAIPQSPSSYLQDYCTYIISTIKVLHTFVRCFEKFCLKNSLYHCSLTHDLSALTKATFPVMMFRIFLRQHYKFFFISIATQ